MALYIKKGHQNSRLAHEQVQQFRIIGRAQTRDRVPTRDSLEGCATATAVLTLDDIVKHLGMLVQHGVNEANGGLALGDPLLVDPVQQGREHRSRGRSSRHESGQTTAEDDDVVRDSGDVRVRTTDTVVDTTVSREAAVVDALVVLVARVVLGEVVRDGLVLVVRALVDVAEATAGGELGDGFFGVGRGVRTGGQVGASGGGEVGAGGREVGRVDLVVVAETVAGTGAAAAACNAGVTRRDDHGDTLHAELHELGTLATLVRDGEFGLRATVRDGDHVRGLVGAAHARLVVPAGHVVRVHGVDVVLAGWVLVAVRAIDGVQEGVEEAGRRVVVGVDGIVGLEENRVLRPDQRVRDLEVEVGFSSGLEGAVHGSTSTVHGPEFGVCARGNLGVDRGEEQVQVRLAVDVAQVFVDTQLVTLGRLVALRDVVHGVDAWWGDCQSAQSQQVTQQLLQGESQFLNDRRQASVAATERALLLAIFAVTQLQTVNTRLDEIDVFLHMLGDVIPNFYD